MADKKARQSRARPTSPSRAAIVAAVCDDLATGELAQVSAKRHGHHAATIRKWCVEDKELGAMYARAREAQAHALAELAITTADGGDLFGTAVRLVIAKEADAASPAVRSAVISQLTNAAIQRDRLRVDTLKWYTSKLAPKLYGERVTTEHEGTIGLAIQYLESDE